MLKECMTRSKLATLNSRLVDCFAKKKININLIFFNVSGRKSKTFKY